MDTPGRAGVGKGSTKLQGHFQILEEVYTAGRLHKKKLDGFANLAARTSKTKVDSNYHANEQFMIMMDIEVYGPPSAQTV